MSYKKNKVLNTYAQLLDREKKSIISVSSEASVSETKNRLLYDGCFLTLLIALESTSHK